MSNLIAQTRYGKVQGSEQGSISVWKGIPFAQPPTGQRRFRAPQPPSPWTGVREATAFSPMAPQVPEMGASMVGALGAESRSARRPIPGMTGRRLPPLTTSSWCPSTTGWGSWDLST